jgi:NAD(P)-dependent dehydrogenase (short-subunit alcohol dehydrogenase family)
VARNPDDLRRTEELGKAARGEIHAIRCDVSDPAAVEGLGADVLARFGQPTIVVNAAGVFGPIALIKDSDPAEWVKTLMIDAVAPYLVTRRFLAGMVDEGWGRIVNVTSAASLHPPGPLNSAYATAKVALNQFTRHLAAEIAGSGVTANVIHPGDVKTDMWADIRDKVERMGPEADAYKAWVRWVEETGGDPPHKAVDLIMDLTSDAGGSRNGEFCWVKDPLQAPIPSWGAATDERPWVTD